MGVRFETYGMNPLYINIKIIKSSLYAPFLERYLGSTEMKKDLYEKIAANVTQDQLTLR